MLRHDLPADVRARAELAAATMTFAMDDVEPARDWWIAAEEHAGADPVIGANAVAGVGLAALATGDLDQAARHFAAALDLAARGGPDAEWTEALAHIWQGTVSLLVGDPDAAVRSIERGLASARRRGDRLTAYIALYNLSQVELARGAHAEARGHLEEGMRLSLETGDHANLAYLLDALAVVEAADGTLARVPLLLGAAQAIRETIGSHGYGYYRPDPAAMAAAAQGARRHLGADRYDDALDTGRALSPRPRRGPGARRARPRGLTPPAQHSYTSHCPWRPGCRRLDPGAVAGPGREPTRGDPVTTTYDPGVHLDARDTTTSGRGRRWALTGVVAGVAGIVSVAASGLVGAVYEEDIAGDAVAITARLAELTTPILVFHTATMVSALLMVVFAAGLRRDLAGRVPADSLLPRWRRPGCCWWRWRSSSAPA